MSRCAQFETNLGSIGQRCIVTTNGTLGAGVSWSMRVRRLDHFGVDVADLARAERFYTDVLGMHVQMRLADQVLLRYGDGACALFLKPDRQPGSLEQVTHPLGKSHHAFEVSWDDYRAAQALFVERGIPHHTPIDWGDHECLYFLDPDGNLLELVGYRDAPPPEEEAH